MDGDTVKMSGCPVMHGGNTGMTSSPTRWWPQALNLDILHQHGARTNLVEYSGGHGWRGDVFGMIRGGVDWLEERGAE